MENIYWLRRTALLLCVFAFGALITGNVPVWIKIGFPTLAIWWLMLYDEATYLKGRRRHD